MSRNAPVAFVSSRRKVSGVPPHVRVRRRFHAKPFFHLVLEEKERGGEAPRERDEREILDEGGRVLSQL